MKKPTSKKDYPFVVKCEKQYETKIVLNFYDENTEHWGHWNYVLIESKDDKDIFDRETSLNMYMPINIISFDEWESLPDFPKPDYEPKDVAFNQREIIGYKLVKEEYKKAAGIIVGFEEEKFISCGKAAFYNNCEYEKKLKKAGVLDLWFEPVYKEPTK